MFLFHITVRIKTAVKSTGNLCLAFRRTFVLFFCHVKPSKQQSISFVFNLVGVLTSQGSLRLMTQTFMSSNLVFFPPRIFPLAQVSALFVLLRKTWITLERATTVSLLFGLLLTCNRLRRTRLIQLPPRSLFSLFYALSLDKSEPGTCRQGWNMKEKNK